MKEESEKPMQKHVDGATIRVGTPLVDKEGNYIGTVKEIQEEGFLVDRSSLHYRDLFVPYWVCLNDGPGQIRLEISQHEVNQSMWRSSDRRSSDRFE